MLIDNDDSPFNTPKTTKNDNNQNIKKELNLAAPKKKETSDNQNSNRVKFAHEEVKFSLENLTYESLNLDFLNYEKVIL